MIKVLNTERKDFSDEFLILMAIVGYCVYGAQIIINKASRACDLERLSGSFFQEKKRYVNAAADAYKKLITNLNVFDEWFDSIQRGRLDYCSFIHQNANDLVKLMLLYFSRTENHPEMRERIFGVIKSFEIDDEADYESIMKYFERTF